MVTEVGYEAQVGVLGSILLEPGLVGQVMAQVRAEDFTSPVYRTIYQAITGLFLEGKAVDPVLVRERLSGIGAIGETLYQIMTLTPTAANVGEYIPIVRKTAVRRRMAGSSPRRDGRRHWTANSRIRRLYCHYDSRCGGTNSIEWSHWLVPTVGGDSSGGCPCGSNWKLGRFSR